MVRAPHCAHHCGIDRAVRGGDIIGDAIAATHDDARHPFRCKALSNLEIAVISLRFSDTFSCPTTRRNPVANALTR